MNPVFVIMADGRREEGAVKLFNKLDEMNRGRFGVMMVIDYERSGSLSTSLRAFTAGVNSPKKTHVVVLQDDVLICSDFTDAAAAALMVVDKSPVSFFANRKEVEEAYHTGHHWVSLDHFIGGQAVALPVDLAKNYLAFAKAREGVTDHDDVMMQMFLQSYSLRMMCTVPSLVEHNGVGKSLMGHSGTNRWGPHKARLFIGENAKAASINWLI